MNIHFSKRILPALCLLLTLVLCFSVAALAASSGQPTPVVDKGTDPYANFARQVSEEEAKARTTYVQTAMKYLGWQEKDGTHRPIIDQYNAHEPLALNYKVTYTDAWCATFVSAMSIECGLTDIIPTECGCDRQIKLFDQLGCWVEDDTYVPLPGDLIYYCWNPGPASEDCTRSSDHVGIVMGVAGDMIIAIEGNYQDGVRCRVIPVDGRYIRGFAIPKYPK